MIKAEQLGPSGALKHCREPSDFGELRRGRGFHGLQRFLVRTFESGVDLDVDMRERVDAGEQHLIVIRRPRAAGDDHRDHGEMAGADLPHASPVGTGRIFHRQLKR
jgi:hypothetical protein